MPEPIEPHEEAALPAYVAPARVAVALIQAGALLWLYRVLQDWTPGASNTALYVALAAIACAVPVLVQLGLGRVRPSTLAVWAAAATAIVCGLVVYDVLRLAVPRRDPVPSPGLIFFGAAMLLIAHALIAAGDAERRIVPAYRTYFDVAWTLGIRLALAGLFVGLFWLLLLLGSAMFGLIGLDFLKHVMRQDWFVIPITTLMIGAGIHLTDLRDHIVRAVRVLVLNLLSWLLPLMALLAVGFLAALPFTGLGRLWSIDHATAMLLLACAALIVLINTAFQDGRADAPSQRILRLPVRIAALALAPLTALGVAGLWLRIGPYGLTPERIGAAACLVVAAVYALGYMAGALRPTRWVLWVERTNVAAAFVVIALILALFSPVADPARLSVADQVRRLDAGAVTPKAFDFAFLRRDGVRYGDAALRRLAEAKDGPEPAAVAARARDALAGTGGEPQAPPSGEVAARILVRPAGRTLPNDFVRQEWGKDGRDVPRCLRDASDCTALIVDLNADGTEEIVLNASHAAEVFHRTPTGWVSLGNLVGGGCAETPKAFREAPFAAAAPEWRDLQVGSQRYRVNPRWSCR